MTHAYIDDDAKLLETRIPEGEHLDGLEYGSHVSRTGRSGYYVRPEGTDRWGLAWLTPAGDELEDPEDDETQEEAIVRAITEELSSGC